jgi:rhodanese-related sulfurtransferase
MIRTRNTVLAATLVTALLALPLACLCARAAEQGAPAASATRAQPYKFKVPKLGRADVDALLASPETVVFLDVRRPDELTKIGGFPAYLSIQSKDLEKNLAYIPRDRTIVTVSNHAARAGAAGDLLVSKGYKVAGAVGAQNYEEEGGTLTRIAAPEPKTAAAGQ